MSPEQKEILKNEILEGNIASLHYFIETGKKYNAMQFMAEKISILIRLHKCRGKTTTNTASELTDLTTQKESETPCLLECTKKQVSMNVIQKKTFFE